MLSNIEPVDTLRSLARTKGRDFITKTINSSLLQEYLDGGWTIAKKNKKSIQMKKAKVHGNLLEDRVWYLMYRMGFTSLSGPGGGKLQINSKDSNSPTTNIDIVALDEETAIAIECKSAEKPSKRPQFQEELGKHVLIREQFTRMINQQFPSCHKRQIALVMFTSNVILSDNDRKRAQEAKVALFEGQDLVYYENLVSHLGPAARYQFLADVLPGKTIPGLTMRVPAIRTKMGGYNCYTFSISPEYLLKIAFVSHRAKGKASDVNTYQRMIRKSRLKAIKSYIDQDGVFPTNIVINFDKKPTFQRGSQEGDQESGTMGWLDLRSAYKSAWIIDGQHRLFAYSGHPWASKARLAVLAFEDLPASKQAELFIDINAEQKSVKQSLLQELYAELHWDATDPSVRVRAIISKAIQSLNTEPDSPFYKRILAADETKDSIRCLSLTSMFGALNSSDLYIASTKGGAIVEYGPLWGGGDNNEVTRKRTVYILNQWFSLVRNAAPEWWDAGSGEGGGLAMNDSVIAIIGVLRSVFNHLSSNGSKLVTLDDEDLFERITKYGEALAQYLGDLSEEERKGYRDLRGIQGQTARMRRCQQAIHEQIPTFLPPGLQDFINTQKAQTNIKAKQIIDRIETILHETILEELKREFGLDESQWWIEGVSKPVRVKVTKRYEEDDGKRGGREYYFDLIDYRTIIQENYTLLGQLLGYGNANASKDKRTTWIKEVNTMRNIVAHVSAGKSISIEQLDQLESYDRWLAQQIAGTQR